MGKVCGYPAYAGIDLNHHIKRFGITGLPRIRGDRPLCLGMVFAAMPATPHTRGST